MKTPLIVKCLFFLNTKMHYYMYCYFMLKPCSTNIPTTPSNDAFTSNMNNRIVNSVR